MNLFLFFMLFFRYLGRRQFLFHGYIYIIMYLSWFPIFLDNFLDNFTVSFLLGKIDKIMRFLFLSPLLCISSPIQFQGKKNYFSQCSPSHVKYFYTLTFGMSDLLFIILLPATPEEGISATYLLFLSVPNLCPK